MKKTSQPLDDMLLDYLDGLLGATEKKNLEKKLQEDKVLAGRLQELQELDLTLRQLTIEQPSKNFTGVVMHKLDQYPKSSGISLRNGILLLLGVLATTAIATLLISAGVFDGSTTIHLSQPELSKKFIDKPLPAIPFNGKLIINIIVFLNVALGFLILDRTILKPFFQRRMETGH